MKVFLILIVFLLGGAAHSAYTHYQFSDAQKAENALMNADTARNNQSDSYALAQGETDINTLWTMAQEKANEMMETGDTIEYRKHVKHLDIKKEILRAVFLQE